MNDRSFVLFDNAIKTGLIVKDNAVMLIISFWPYSPIICDCVATFAKISENSPSCARIIPIDVAFASSIAKAFKTIVLKNIFQAVIPVNTKKTMGQFSSKNLRSNMSPTDKKKAIIKTF